MYFVRTDWKRRSSISWLCIFSLIASLKNICQLVCQYIIQCGGLPPPPKTSHTKTTSNLTSMTDISVHWCFCVCLPACCLLKQCVSVLPLAVSCGAPKAPINGGVLTADYSVGTRVSYFCNDGYRLSSKELTSAICQPDGTWSNHNKIPRCSGL